MRVILSLMNNEPTIELSREIERMRAGDREVIWAYAINKRGKVSKAGSVVSEEEAAQLVADGEARWRKGSTPRTADPHAELVAAIRRGDARGKFSDEEIEAAVKAGLVAAGDAMNQDT